MSKPELYKDKIEVALDGRQIFYLFFGGAVIVGMVFVLGVVVGRRVESRGHTDAAMAAAAAKADPLAALDKLDGKGTTYQGVLTGAASGAPAAPTKVESMIAAIAPPAAAAAAAPAPAAAVAIESPVAPAEDKKDGDKKDGDKKDGDNKAGDKKDGDKKDGEKKKTRYALQLASFQDKTEAESFQSNVKGASLTEAEVSGKTYYRVRLGSYRSLEAANDAKAGYDKGAKKPASVMKL